jgi:hypothetical protein
MPIGRYFAVVGSLLLAMLFIADWLVLKGQTQSDASGKAGKPTIVLRSDQKWPERVVFDTSAPIVVSLVAPHIVDAPVTRPPREAFALLAAPLPRSLEPPPLPVRTKRKVMRRASHFQWFQWTAYRPTRRTEGLPSGW